MLICYPHSKLVYPFRPAQAVNSSVLYISVPCTWQYNIRLRILRGDVEIMSPSSVDMVLKQPDPIMILAVGSAHLLGSGIYSPTSRRGCTLHPNTYSSPSSIVECRGSVCTIFAFLFHHFHLKIAMSVPDPSPNMYNLTKIP